MVNDRQTIDTVVGTHFEMSKEYSSFQFLSELCQKAKWVVDPHLKSSRSQMIYFFLKF